MTTTQMKQINENITLEDTQKAEKLNELVRGLLVQIKYKFTLSCFVPEALFIAIIQTTVTGIISIA
jgi:hypothetical protein